MSIPLEQFSATPVFALEPQGSVHHREEEYPKSKVKKSGSFRERMSEIPSFFRSSFAQDDSVNSAPNSPMVRQKRNKSVSGGYIPTSNLQSSQLMTSSLTSFSNIQEDEYENCVVAGSVTNLQSGPNSLEGTKTLGRSFRRSSARHEMMSVCVDCREMVLQVIRAQSTARRLQLAKSLFLSQAPAPTTSTN